MKIIQTFWSNQQQSSSSLEFKAGWLSPEYHWMSWALSCLLLRRHYDTVELYTDVVGKHILIDILQLPYTDVHIVFDENFKIHPELFALAKIKTYSLQNEPFIHIDSDVFLWEPLPSTIMDSEVIASNVEIDLFFNREALEAVKGKFSNTPSHLEGILDEENIFAANAGIIGGNNISFLKKYCVAAFDFITANEKQLDKIKTNGLNWLVEQISLFYLAKQEEVPIHYLMSEPITHPLYHDYWLFADIPNVKLIHPVGGCKKMPYVLYHLANRLRLEFPHYYYKILQIFKNNNLPIRNQLYQHINLDSVRESISLKTHSFKNIDDTSLNTIASPSFKKAFERTLNLLKYESLEIPKTQEALHNAMDQYTLQEQLKEVYDLETLKLNQFYRLLQNWKKDNEYHKQYLHYEQIACFFLVKGWTYKTIQRKKEVLVLHTGWAWNLSGNSEEDAYSKILSQEKEDYLCTLNDNLLQLKIEETYHEGLDALILKFTEQPKRIDSLLQELLEYFDEGLTTAHPDYQTLIFDTLKRLAFTNLITIQ